MNDHNHNPYSIWQIKCNQQPGGNWDHFKKEQIIASMLKGDNSKSIFIEEMDIGDIVIATDNKDKVILGIGIIDGNYCEKPLEQGSIYGLYLNTRHVDWKITENIEVNAPIRSDGTGIYDIKEIACKDYETIKNYYTQQDIGLEFFRKYQEIEYHDIEFKPLPEIVEAIKTTKNIIIYGSPGTGKTYLVNQFAEAFLENQLKSPLNPERNLLDVIQGLTWYQSIALAMYTGYINEESGKRFKVTELVKDDLITAYWATTKTQKLSNMIHAMLQIHTDPKVKSVKYSIERRQSPYLFEKDLDGYWFLTDTGKEYVEDILGEQLQSLKSPPLVNTDISKYLRFVTFHQSFAYEEFLEGIKPRISNIEEGFGEVGFGIQDGVFKQICREAERDSENSYLIIIDEINRANIAKVFGELITLIEDDKRLGTDNELRVILPYSQEEFGVPQNLYILGTMNTSDRSIALLDIALRRRFTFIELKPNPGLLEDKQIEGVSLAPLLINLNQCITALIGRDYQIGHSYFINITSLAELRFAWYHRVIPLLQEYFYHDSTRLKVVIGNEFMEEIEINSNLRSSLSEFIRDEIQYEVKYLEDDGAFRSALLSIYS
jgi:Cdc6-like AAA superfamily ATPase